MLPLNLKFSLSVQSLARVSPSLGLAVFQLTAKYRLGLPQDDCGDFLSPLFLSQQLNAHSSGLQFNRETMDGSVIMNFYISICFGLFKPNFSQVLGPTIAQKLHLLKLQVTCFLRQTKATPHC